MPRTPTTITRSLLAAVRPGVVVFAHLGASVQLPRHRARSYVRRARADLGTMPPPSSGVSLAPRSTIAVVEVRGVLEQRAAAWSCGESAGYDEITARMLAANDDPAVAGVVVDGDTPGGDGPGLSECSRRIRVAFDASRKPLLWSANELCASAGFWLASVCDVVHAPEMARIGSIGALVAHQSEARALDAEGIDTYVARDPAGKAVPSPIEPLDELGKARLDAMAASATARFFAHVSARRPRLTPDVLRALNAEVLEAPDALARGLIDGIGSLEETIAMASALAQRIA